MFSAQNISLLYHNFRCNTRGYPVFTLGSLRYFRRDGSRLKSPKTGGFARVGIKLVSGKKPEKTGNFELLDIVCVEKTQKTGELHSFSSKMAKMSMFFDKTPVKLVEITA